MKLPKLNGRETKLGLAGFLVGVILAMSLAVLAQTNVFNIFSPGPSGPVKSNGTFALQQEFASDIVGLWSGCGVSTPFMGYAGTCLGTTGCTFAAPSGSVGPTEVTGSTGDCMDAGSAPPLNEAANFTLSGLWTFGTNAVVFNAGTTYANNEPQQGKSTGGTTYTALVPYDSSNNTDLVNDANGTVCLKTTPTAGGSLVTGLCVVPENSTYSQAEVMDAGGTEQYAGFLDVPPDTSSCSTSCTVAAANRGKLEDVSTGGGTITWPSSTLENGAAVSFVVCCSSTATTFTVGAGMTLVWPTGSAEDTGNRSVLYGIVTMVQLSSTTVLISGNGIS